jgi:phosphate:Na+ symporter
LNLLAINLRAQGAFYDNEGDRENVEIFSREAGFDVAYSSLKQLEGAILQYVIRLQRTRLADDESARLGELIVSVRNAVHSAKSMKDVRGDLLSFRESADDIINAYYRRYQVGSREFYSMLETLRNASTESLMFELLVDLNEKNEELHSATHSQIYHDMAAGRLSEEEVSTLLNVNREVLHSNRSILAAIAGVSLPAEQADTFTSLP